METRLSFGSIIQLSNHLYEVIVDYGVEMDMRMMKEYHNFFRDNVSGDVVILINKKNSYTYTFDVQQQIRNVPNMKAMAVLIYDNAKEISTKFIINLPNNHSWNVSIFRDRKEAINWLETQYSAS